MKQTLPGDRVDQQVGLNVRVPVHAVHVAGPGAQGLGVVDAPPRGLEGRRRGLLRGLGGLDYGGRTGLDLGRALVVIFWLDCEVIVEILAEA